MRYICRIHLPDMKKTILLLTAAFGGMTIAAAQDLIVKKDATQVEAKVTEITPDAVRYKRFSNPDGPTYVVPVVEIDYIQYVNGEKDYFKAQESIPATKLTPAVSAGSAPLGQTPEPTSAVSEAQESALAPGTRYVVKEYEIGELYDQNGLRGIVCQLDESRQHGLLISLDEKALNWSIFRKHNYKLTGADDRKDGEVNMETVAAYIAANNLSWSDFPAFAWCREQGDGWYLPAIDELLTIGHNYNGGTRMRNDRRARSTFNDNLKSNGGERMDRLVYYFSSTEMDQKSAFTTHMSIEPPYVTDVPKAGITFLVRAVHKF